MLEAFVQHQTLTFPIFQKAKCKSYCWSSFASQDPAIWNVLPYKLRCIHLFVILSLVLFCCIILSLVFFCFIILALILFLLHFYYREGIFVLLYYHKVFLKLYCHYFCLPVVIYIKTAVYFMHNCLMLRTLLFIIY